MVLVCVLLVIRDSIQIYDLRSHCIPARGDADDRGGEPGLDQARARSTRRPTSRCPASSAGSSATTPATAAAGWCAASRTRTHFTHLRYFDSVADYEECTQQRGLRGPPATRCTSTSSPTTPTRASTSRSSSTSARITAPSEHLRPGARRVPRRLGLEPGACRSWRPPGTRSHAPSLQRVDGGAASTVWVDEIVDLIEVEDLTDVVLVGHSQGGVVVREVALRVPERMRHLVYLDAAVPDPGERAVDLGPGAAGQPAAAARHRDPAAAADGRRRPRRRHRRVDERAARARRRSRPSLDPVSPSAPTRAGDLRLLHGHARGATRAAPPGAGSTSAAPPTSGSRRGTTPR